MKDLFPRGGQGKTLEQLYNERHRILGDFFSGKTGDFALKGKEKEYGCKMLVNKDGVIVFRIENRKKYDREWHFEHTSELDAPSCVVIIDNRADSRQTVCIQNRKKSFDKPQKVAEILETALNRHLVRHRLHVGIKAKYATSEFWRTVGLHPEGIESVEFHFPYPNMSEISDLVTEITSLARTTNSEPTLSLHGQNKENLTLSPDMDFIVRAIAACAASGKPVLIKPKGKRRVEIGVYSPVKEELPDAVFDRLGEADLFDNLTPLLEFLKGIKLVYDE